MTLIRLYCWTLLLDNNDKYDNNEARIIKHSSYYSELEFPKLLNKKGGLSILSVFAFKHVG